MSTYVIRHIEVRRRQIDSRRFNNLEHFESLVPELEVGHYYLTYGKGYVRMYFHIELDQSGNKMAVPVECDDIPVKWELVKWWSEADKGYSYEENDKVVTADSGKLKLREHSSFCDNGGAIRDTYLSDWNDLGIDYKDRGWPNDMSEELKAKLEKDCSEGGTWNHTYVTLSEFYKVQKLAFEKLRQRITEKINGSNFDIINKKLDILMLKVKDPFYEPPVVEKKDEEEEYYDETLDYLFDEYLGDILCLTSELNFVHGIVEETYDYIISEDIRIIYYFA